MIGAIATHPDGVRLVLHVQPRARRTEIVGFHGEAIKLRLQALPVDGAANQALVRFLADRLGTPAAQVRLIAGHTTRRKVVVIAGASPEEVRRALEI